MPCLRHSSVTGVPAACSLRIPKICSSVYRDRFIRPSPSGPDSTPSWLIFRGARQLAPPAEVIDMRVYSPFLEPDLPALLHRRGTKSLVITGAETDLCVLATVSRRGRLWVPRCACD
ncbi:MAG: isochorismatase family protein [Stellaceae bacterium]